MSSYRLHPEALIDLDEIWEWLAENAENNVDAADRVIGEIFDRIRNLVPFPHQGHRRPDLTSRPLRFTIVRDYLIAYMPSQDHPLYVIAVIHGRRSPRIIAAMLRSREDVP